MSCFETLQDYGLRAIGIGERLLPKSDFTLCEHVVLIGSGMIWNLYFALFALFFGFFLAIGLATSRASEKRWLRLPAQSFIFVIRGSPLFIQFFIAYETFVLIPKLGYDLNLGFIEITVEIRWLTKAWLGALIVLFLNTAAYTAQIFYGALQAIPRGDIEAADAIGMKPTTKFRRIVFPSMLRLAWESYTNEAIFLFHATALVFFASFPAWRQKGDALYYANYFADKTFNPFVPYPIIAAYFIFFTLVLILVFSTVGRRLNRHIKR